MLARLGRVERGLMGSRRIVALVLAPVLVGVGALVVDFKTRAQRRSVEAELLARVAGAGMQLRSATPDFAARLPQNERAGPWLNWLKEACSANNVVLEGVTTWKSSETAAVLGRAGIVMEARGGYGSLKTVIGGALDRFPNMALKSLSLRRATQATDVQARIELVVLLRPADSLGAVAPSSGHS